MTVAVDVVGCGKNRFAPQSCHRPVRRRLDAGGGLSGTGMKGECTPGECGTKLCPCTSGSGASGGGDGIDVVVELAVGEVGGNISFTGESLGVMERVSLIAVIAVVSSMYSCKT